MRRVKNAASASVLQIYIIYIYIYCSVYISNIFGYFNTIPRHFCYIFLYKNIILFQKLWVTAIILLKSFFIAACACRYSAPLSIVHILCMEKFMEKFITDVDFKTKSGSYEYAHLYVSISWLYKITFFLQNFTLNVKKYIFITLLMNVSIYHIWLWYVEKLFHHHNETFSCLRCYQLTCPSAIQRLSGYGKKGKYEDKDLVHFWCFL